jgi:hypothetical protein
MVRITDAGREVLRGLEDRSVPNESVLALMQDPESLGYGMCYVYIPS